MTNRELKKLTRADLLEMLILKCQENEMLQAQLEEAQRQLAERPMEKTVPAAQLNAMMRALKLAAEQYLESAGDAAEEAAV